MIVVMSMDSHRMACSLECIDAVDDFASVIEITGAVHCQYGRELLAGERILRSGADFFDH